MDEWIQVGGIRELTHDKASTHVCSLQRCIEGFSSNIVPEAVARKSDQILSQGEGSTKDLHVNGTLFL